MKKLYDAGRWTDVVQAVQESTGEAADLELYRGLALAQLQRWEEARKTFEAGFVRSPRDTRFLAELAGIAYRERRFSRAKRELRRALAIDPRDAYAITISGYAATPDCATERKETPRLAEITFL